MSLERKDVRLKMFAPMHAALTVLAEIDGIDIGEFAERVLVAAIQGRVHAASVIARRCAGLGISGNVRESTGAGAADRRGDA